MLSAPFRSKMINQSSQVQAAYSIRTKMTPKIFLNPQIWNIMTVIWIVRITPTPTKVPIAISIIWVIRIRISPAIVPRI